VPFFNCRGGLFFCLDTKEPKSQDSRNASLRTRPLRCKFDKTWAGNLLRPDVAQGRHAANISYALQPHRPPLFCCISPEAVLLTVCLQLLFSVCHMQKSKEAQRHVRKAGREYGLAG
jgi:hypothetical protein